MKEGHVGIASRKEWQPTPNKASFQDSDTQLNRGKPEADDPAPNYHRQPCFQRYVAESWQTRSRQYSQTMVPLMCQTKYSDATVASTIVSLACGVDTLLPQLFRMWQQNLEPATIATREAEVPLHLTTRSLPTSSRESLPTLAEPRKAVILVLVAVIRRFVNVILRFRTVRRSAERTNEAMLFPKNIRH